MGVVCPLGEERADGSIRSKPRAARHGERLAHQVRRDPDVHDLDAARMRRPVVEEEARFAGGHRDREVRADRVFLRDSGVAVEPGRHVEGDDGGGLTPHPPRERVYRRPQRPRHPDAEEGVHDEVRWVGGRELPDVVKHVEFEPVLVFGHVPEEAEVARRVLGRVLFRRERDDADTRATPGQHARHHEPVAAVVALPGEHEHAPPGQRPVHVLDDVRGAAPCCLHEREAGDAELLDRAPVGRAHGLGGEERLEEVGGGGEGGRHGQKRCELRGER